MPLANPKTLFAVLTAGAAIWFSAFCDSLNVAHASWAGFLLLAASLLVMVAHFWAARAVREADSERYEAVNLQDIFCQLYRVGIRPLSACSALFSNWQLQHLG